MTKNIKKEITNVANFNQFESQSVLNEILVDKFEEKNNKLQGIIDHCYFNRKEYEITQVEFAAIKNDNIREILLMMQYGKMRMISVIYPKEVFMVVNTKKSLLSSGEMKRMDEDDMLMDG